MNDPVARHVASALPAPGPVRAIEALILREVSTAYARSPGGYLWALLAPVGMVAILAFAFSMAFRTPALGTSFLMFYATGYVPYRLFTEVQGATAGALRSGRALLAFPSIAPADLVAARFVLAAVTQLLAGLVILAGVAIWSGEGVVPDPARIVLSLVLALVLALGAGTFAAPLFDRWPVLQTLYGILTRPLLLASGVLYLYDDLPAPIAAIVWFNPLVHVTATMRAGFYPYYHPAADSALYVAGLAGALLAGGLVALRFHRRLLAEG